MKLSLKNNTQSHCDPRRLDVPAEIGTVLEHCSADIVRQHANVPHTGEFKFARQVFVFQRCAKSLHVKKHHPRKSDGYTLHTRLLVGLVHVEENGCQDGVEHTQQSRSEILTGHDWCAHIIYFER